MHVAVFEIKNIKSENISIDLYIKFGGRNRISIHL